MLNNRVRAAGFAEILPRALSCAVLLLLLVAVLSRGKRCSIAKILRQYRAVIFHEIQNLKNLSGWEGRSGRAGPACRSDKDQKILLSIYNISMSLREVAAGTLRGPEELAVWKVARNTDFVLRENCRKISKVGALPLPSHSSGSQFPGPRAEPALLCALLAAHEESPGSARSIPGVRVRAGRVAGGC
ncbi:uncharacterized protein C20orf204 homolog isoform 3-T3 [Theristicus caerulescens]